MKEVYKIAEFQHFFKYIKKNDKFTDSKNVSYVLTDFNSLKEAEDWIKEKELNLYPYGNPNGCHYEKIGENTFKLTYENCKTYRILSYQICKFLDVE